MKRRCIGLWLLVSLLLFSGCSGEQISENFTQPTGGYWSVAPVGQVPEKLKAVVEEDLFHGITVFDGRLLKVESSPLEDGTGRVSQTIRMLDLYGRELAAYTCFPKRGYHVTTLTATDDGGFLFVLGFADYADGQNVWASESGFASRVIKCDRNGTVQFDAAFENLEGAALEYCFEKGGCFYFFGTVQTPETKITGVHSPTDVYMARIDPDGILLDSQCIGGSDYDSLHGVRMQGDDFMLSVSAQSNDGFFTVAETKATKVDWVVKVSDTLDVTEKKMETDNGYSDCKIGVKDGKPVYTTDELLKGFDAGTPEAVIDYGDYYLVVSQNITGEYEKTPLMISSIWYYTQSVYSAYDDAGKLLFRAAVDSSPDFDAMAQGLPVS